MSDRSRHGTSHENHRANPKPELKFEHLMPDDGERIDDEYKKSTPGYKGNQKKKRAEKPANTPEPPRAAAVRRTRDKKTEKVGKLGVQAGGNAGEGIKATSSGKKVNWADKKKKKQKKKEKKQKETFDLLGDAMSRMELDK